MKRTRDNGTPGPQVNRQERLETASEVAELAQMMQRLTPDDVEAHLKDDAAVAYLKDVKDVLEDDKEKYDEFVNVSKDFMLKKINTAGVISRVGDLFKENPSLIFGFKKFLPKGYEICLQANQEVEFDRAINFVNRIKTRFQNDEHVYRSFVDIVNMIRKRKKSSVEAYSEVSILFMHHPDLVEEFNNYLTESSTCPWTTSEEPAARSDLTGERPAENDYNLEEAG